MPNHEGSAAAPCPPSLEAIRIAGLRYVDGSGPGIQRRRCGRGFVYVSAERGTIRDRQELQRIKSLAVPPAWRRVWICPSRFGHIQAFGWDARGRKQYRYHPLFRQVRDHDKFGRMIAFGTALALIRKKVSRDFRRSGLPREKVLAAVVRLLETTYIRIGNEEYEKENASYGLTTLRNRHVRTSGGTVRFRFRGKSGLLHSVELNDRTVARIVRECQELPGYRLFQYIDADGNPCNLDSGDANNYLREITGEEFSAKDFRTWAGTVLAARELFIAGPCQTETERKRTVVAAIKRVAQQLGNRPATCRKFYIHPAILDAYADGSLFQVMKQGQKQEAAYNGRGLRPEEYSVMVLITRHLEKTGPAHILNGRRKPLRAKAA